ncbi:RWP-RK domain-containing protein [Trema orientale]|uniref:RWP-RK domain-containing protein n=1 Tax=Trema orientale TaxID=63057 RepID=A0A2P5EB47_TREOI|nr:RWP-RK domain-containing protein [Trema orientale]
MRMLCILLEYATTSVCGGSHKSNVNDGGDVTILIIQFYHPPPLLTCIPSLLTLSRNPKLRAIPSLANDLETIFHMICVTDDKEPSRVLSERTCQRNNQNHHQLRRNVPVLDQDLNCLPYPVTPSELSDDQQIEQSSSGTMEKKKKRATSKDIARIALSDLAKYFDLPIVEASRNLKVGLTEEREWQQQDNKAAAMAVAKRQRMLENERESIEKKPFWEMKTETKRFRQDVFKRKHRARVLGTQSLFLPDN